MIEDKLHQAAKKLPAPNLSFDTIKGKNRRAGNGGTVKSKRLVAALAVAVCLLVTACAAVRISSTYRLWSGMSSNSTWDLKNWTRKEGYELPETLGDCFFVKIHRLHGAPSDAGLIEAKFFPTSNYASVDYESETSEEDENTQQNQSVSVSVISTNDTSWRWHFSMNEENVFSHPDIQEGSYATEEYKGMTLQTAWIGDSSYVVWVDEGNQACVMVSVTNHFGTEYKGDMETSVALAKELIDLNQ